MTDKPALPISKRLKQAIDSEGTRKGYRFVITFATVGIRDGWIEVVAYGYDAEQIAMAWANSEYGRWSSIYSADFFAKFADSFPAGKLGETVILHDRPEHFRPWLPPWADWKPEFPR